MRIFLTGIPLMVLLLDGCAALQYTGQMGGANTSPPPPAGTVRPTFRF